MRLLVEPFTQWPSMERSVGTLATSKPMAARIFRVMFIVNEDLSVRGRTQAGPVA